MKDIESTQILVNTILKNYSLCNYCIGRLISKKLSLKPSNSLGKKFNSNTKKIPLKKCFICKNIFETLNQVVEHMIENSSSYKFSTFLVGITLKPSVTDNDDFIKSKFRIRGGINIKTQINYELGKKFARRTKTKTDIEIPDITFKINFKDDSCRIQSRSLFAYGRYTKNRRNIPQKQTSCKNCQGKGCVTCNFHWARKFNSVEGQITKFLNTKYNSKRVKINWIGGEDKSSLISGNGRPFFVKIFEPHIRKLRFKKKISLDGIELYDLRQIQAQPKDSVPFRSSVSILVKSENPFDDNLLKKLHLIKKNPLLIYNRREKTIEKSIYDLRYKKSDPNSLKIFILLDGGVPIKSFVEKSSVKPNLSELLENKCTCIQFDFKQIDVMGKTNKN